MLKLIMILTSAQCCAATLHRHRLRRAPVAHLNVDRPLVRVPIATIADAPESIDVRIIRKHAIRYVRRIVRMRFELQE
jgi:hypothetical protein